MEKMVWAKPEMNEMSCEANEYIAACWGLHCLVDGNDGFGQDYGGHRDTPGTCGSEDSYYIRDKGNDQYEIVEDHETQGFLPGTFYEEIDYTNHTVTGTGSSTITITQAMKEANDGEITLYWTTQFEYGNSIMKYFHYGIVNFFSQSVRAS